MRGNLYSAALQVRQGKQTALGYGFDRAKDFCRLTFNASRYIVFNMIKTFRCKHTQALFEGDASRPFRAIAKIAERKLQQLDSAATLDFLRSPPGNRLELLKHDRAGQYSIRINDQWRVCFVWSDGGVYDVEIVDYH